MHVQLHTPPPPTHPPPHEHGIRGPSVQPRAAFGACRRGHGAVCNRPCLPLPCFCMCSEEALVTVWAAAASAASGAAGRRRPRLGGLLEVTIASGDRCTLAHAATGARPPLAPPPPRRRRQPAGIRPLPTGNFASDTAAHSADAADSGGGCSCGPVRRGLMSGGGALRVAAGQGS